MTNDKSWELNSYPEGKWRVSERKNLENDRIDEGDFPENPENNQMYAAEDQQNDPGQTESDNVVQTLEDDFSKDVLIL